jgi:hypothetical protein
MFPRRMPRWLFAALLIISGPSYATFCKLPSPQGAPQQVSFGVVEVAPDAQVGTVLARRTSIAWTSGPAGFCWGLLRNLSLARPATLRSGGVHETGVPGVGMRITFHYNGSAHVLPENMPVADKRWAVHSEMKDAYFSVELIKTGHIDRGGVLRPGSLARAGFNYKEPLVRLDLVDGSVVVRRLVCPFLERPSDAAVPG